MNQPATSPLYSMISRNYCCLQFSFLFSRIYCNILWLYKYNCQIHYYSKKNSRYVCALIGSFVEKLTFVHIHCMKWCFSLNFLLLENVECGKNASIELFFDGGRINQNKKFVVSIFLIASWATTHWISFYSGSSTKIFFTNASMQ